MRNLADEVETGRELDWETFQVSSELYDTDEILSSCTDYLVNSIISVRLAEVSTAYRELSETGIDHVDDALDQTNTALRKALGCSPLDGHAWLRLAIVESRTSGLTDDVTAMLRMSYRTAPNESWIVRYRLPFASQLYESGATEIGDELANDIYNTMHWGRQDDIAYQVMSAPPSTLQFYFDAFAEMDPVRQKKAHRAAEKLAIRLKRKSPLDDLLIAEPATAEPAGEPDVTEPDVTAPAPGAASE